MSDIIPNIFIIDQAEKKIHFNEDNLVVAFYNGVFDEPVIRDSISYDSFPLSAYEKEETNGYTSGGVDVTGNTVTVDLETDEVYYDIDDVVITASGGPIGPIRYAGLYNSSNNNNFIYFFDFLEEKTVEDGASFKLRIDNEGLMKAKQNN